MSVLQVEEYYVFLKFKTEADKETKDKIRGYLYNDNINAASLTDVSMTVDSFEEEWEAEEFEARCTHDFEYLF